MTINDRKVQIIVWRKVRRRPVKHLWQGAMAEILDFSWLIGPIEIRVWRKGARGL